MSHPDPKTAAKLRDLLARAEALDATRPRDSDQGPGMPGNDAAALVRETRSLLKDTVLLLVEMT